MTSLLDGHRVYVTRREDLARISIHVSAMDVDRIFYSVDPTEEVLEWVEENGIEMEVEDEWTEHIPYEQSFLFPNLDHAMLFKLRFL